MGRQSAVMQPSGLPRLSGGAAVGAKLQVGGAQALATAGGVQLI